MAIMPDTAEMMAAKLPNGFVSSLDVVKNNGKDEKDDRKFIQLHR